MRHTTVRDSDYCSRHVGASGLVRIVSGRYRGVCNLFGVSYAISFYDFDLYPLSLYFMPIPPSQFALKITLWNLSRLIRLFYILYSLRDSRRYLTQNFACFTWNNLLFWFLPTYWRTTAILFFCNPFSEHYAPCIFKPHVPRSLYAF